MHVFWMVACGRGHSRAQVLHECVFRVLTKYCMAAGNYKKICKNLKSNQKHLDEVALELLGNVASYHNDGGAVSLVVAKTMDMENEKSPEIFFFLDFTGKSGLGG